MDIARAFALRSLTVFFLLAASMAASLTLVHSCGGTLHAASDDPRARPVFRESARHAVVAEASLKALDEPWARVEAKKLAAAYADDESRTGGEVAELDLEDESD